MNAHEIMAKYAEGQRDFRHLSLCDLSFINEDLSGADFSYTNLTGTSFLNCNLEHTKFVKCKTGQRPILRLGIILLACVTVFFSTWFAAYFSVYASSTSISKVVLIVFFFLLY